MQACNRSRRADRFPLAGRKTREGEQFAASVLQTVGDGFVFQPPFADERLAFRLNFLLRSRVDHILVAVLKFLARPLRRMSQQITVFVHRAPLNRHIGPKRG